MANIAKRQYEFLRFCLVGAVNTGVDFMVFTVLNFWSVPLLMAQFMSYTCGVLNSFLMNRTWTFRRSGQSAGQFIRFLALNLLTLTITYGFLVWFHNHLEWPMLVSKLVATGASLGINFAGSRLWVFAKLINAEDNDRAARVAVVGPTVVENLMGDSNADIIGKNIKINNVIFQVVGVTVSQGFSGPMNNDDMIYVPLTTAQMRLIGNKYLCKFGSNRCRLLGIYWH